MKIHFQKMKKITKIFFDDFFFPFFFIFFFFFVSLSFILFLNSLVLQ